MIEMLSNFSVGTVVTTRTTKVNKWILNSILNVDEENNYIEIGLRKEYADNLLMPEEEIEISITTEAFLYNALGKVIDFSIAPQPRIKIRIESIKKIENKREEQRYKVNLHSVLRGQEILIPEGSLVIDISNGGLGILSRQNIAVNSQVFVDIFIEEDKLIKLIGNIVRKKANGYNIEYGLAITSIDDDNKKLLQEFLDGLGKKENETISIIKRIRNNNC